MNATARPAVYTHKQHITRTAGAKSGTMTSASTRFRYPGSSPSAGAAMPYTAARSLATEATKARWRLSI